MLKHLCGVHVCSFLVCRCDLPFLKIVTYLLFKNIAHILKNIK